MVTDSRTLYEAVPSSTANEETSSVVSKEKGTFLEKHKVLDLLTRPCRDLHVFLSDLSTEYGWRFVTIVALVYGFNQGFGEGYLGQSSLYFLKDNLQLEPTQTTAVLAAAHIPWNMKTIYGSWSDAMPIFGYHRIPYIAIAGAIGTMAWTILATTDSTSTFLVTTMLFVINISIASPDVIIDAAVAERVAQQPKFGPHLQSLCWGAFGVGGILSRLSAGLLNEQWGPQFLFGVGALSAVTILIPAILNFLHEKPTTNSFNESSMLHSSSIRKSNDIVMQRNKCLQLDLGVLREHWPLFLMVCGLFSSIVVVFFFHGAYIIAACAITLGLSGFVLSTDGILIANVVIAIVVCVTVYVLLALAVPAVHLRRATVMEKIRHGGTIAKPVIFIFLNGCVQPSVGDTIFYWTTDDLCNATGINDTLSDKTCIDHGPMFNEVFISHMSCAGYAGFLLGIVVYNKYLAKVRYRTIFLIATAAQFLVSLLELVFILRWNLALGISDTLFAVGDNAIAPIARRFYAMPMMLLAAQLCPPGMEATLFACIMALSNFGSDVGSYFGIILQRVFEVSRSHYDNLWIVVLLRSFCKGIPALLVYILVPDISPQDKLVDLDDDTPDEED